MADRAKKIASLSADKLRQLMDRLKEGAFAAERIGRTPRDGGPLPLSFSQERLWFLDRFGADSVAYNIPAAALLHGPLDTASLRRTFEEVARRHESLRARFGERDGTPFQTIAPEANLELPGIDLEGLPEDRREDEALRWAAEAARLPFDLARGSLLRTLLFRLSVGESVLALTLHHIVADGWSIGVLIREVAALYAAFASGKPSPLPELPLQYADYAIWQRNNLQGETLEREIAFWRERLAGTPPLDLVPDRPRPSAQSFKGARRELALTLEETRALHALGHREGATPFMVLLALFQTLLLRFTGQTDLAVGSPVANRDRDEVQGLIGFFVNTLVLRVDLSGRPSVAEALRRVREIALAAYEHAELPFEKLVEELQPEREAGRNPLFQALFTLQDPPGPAARIADLELALTDLDTGTAKVDLTLIWREPEGCLVGCLEYATDLFEAATAERLLHSQRALLRAAAERPDAGVWELPLLDEAERRQILTGWNRTAADFPREAPVHELFEEQAARGGDRIAIESDDEQVTYAELNARANQLAHCLRRMGVEPESLVGLSVPRSPEMVEGLLGIAKAGGAYLPLDPAYPRERLRRMIEEARPAALVTLEPLLTELPELNGPVVCLDRDREALSGEETGNPASGATADSLVYVMYTSGSTGEPKGVAVPHRGVARLVRGASYARLDAEQVFFQLAPLAFDASTLEIWGPLANGGRLALAPPGTPSLAELGRALRRHGVTTLWLTAGLFHQMVDEGIGGLEGLSQLLAGGDVLSAPHVLRALAALPGCDLINGYGPTENTTFTCCFRIAPDDPPGVSVPIGKPIANTRVYLLDRELRPVPVGVPGELYAGGDGLARGYLGRPDLTAERFVPSPLAGAEDAPGVRLYRTGDLARWRPDGAIEFLGRLDQQVKIRGFRVEPGEIEAVLTTHPEVAGCAVVAREIAGTRALVAYVVCGKTPPAMAELREHLRRRLPEPMVPSFFVALPDLPLTPNGKVNRRALPDPEREPLPAELLEPRTPMEELLAGIWAEALGLERVGVHESFFDLGGHSLLATRVVSRLRRLSGVDLPLRALFEQPTVAALAAAVERASQAPVSPLVPRPRGTEAPLSPAQERLWFLDRLEPGNPVYNVPLALRLRGPASAPALAAAFAAVADRHEILRTRLVESAGRPAQKIAHEARFLPAAVDLTGLPAAARKAEAAIQAGMEARRPFDLTAGPLCRAALLRLEEEEEEHLLMINIHHIAFDGWSMEILLRELGLLYGAAVSGKAADLPPLPIQYADFALWQRAWLESGGLAAQLEAWRERLAGAPTALDLPTDRRRPVVQTFRGGAEPVALPAELVRRLRTFGRRSGATLFMTVLAGWSALLHRSSGAPEVVVGSPVANRRQPELEGLIGLFVNTLPLRVDLAGDPPFAELVDRTRATALAAYEYQDVPFERLIEAAGTERDLSRSPLFQTMLALTDGARPVLRLPGVIAEEVPIHNGTAKFELLLALSGLDGGFEGGLEFNADLFDAATARRLADRLARLLSGAAAEPQRRIGDLPLLDPAEERQILVDWNATEAPFPRHLGLHELFIAQAARTPQATALIHGERRVTYAELAAWAGGLASRLRAMGVGPEVLVGVFCGRTPAMVAAVLAVLEAGGAYLPLDPSYPAERLAFLLADAGALVVLAEESVVAALPGFAGTTVLVDHDRASAEPGERPRGFVHPEQAAYAIYTSGSTGTPKGVIVRHGSAVNRIAWAVSAYSPEVLSGVLAATSLCFDLSVFEIFVPLAAGGAVVLADDALALPGLPAASEVTLVNTVPSAMAELVRTVALPRSVRVVNLAGEPLRRDLAVQIYAREGIEEVHNLYGPSEDTTYSTGARVEREDGREPAIGRPLPNTRVYLLDAGFRPVPVGAPGELWIGGAGVARGYLRRPDLTADRFRPDPFGPAPGGRLYRTGDLARQRADGTLDYLGRLDHQVKIRGFRIEPGEIESALLALPGVRQAVIEAREIAGSKALAAYMAGEEPLPAPAALRELLRRQLPEHMIPACFVILPALPLTPNGKVDRKALPAPEWQGAAEGYLAPRTPAEGILAGIWADLLGLERVGLSDSFFDLGGHSLLATRMMSRLLDVFGVELPLRELFAASRLEDFAARIQAAQQAGASRRTPPLLPVSRQRRLPLSFAQRRLWFLDRFEPGSVAYVIPLAVELEGPLQVPALAGALSAIGERHEVLRTIFPEGEGEPEQLILAATTGWLPVVDLEELPPNLRESEARRVARREAGRPFDLERGPLVRFRLLRLGSSRHVLLGVVHHIVSDGWSLGVLLSEMSALYEGRELAPLAVQYADYAVWQRELLAGDGLERELSYWRHRLAGVAPLELPTDRPRPLLRDSRGASLRFPLQEAQGAGVKRLALKTGATPFMVFLTAFQALLSRLSGQTDLTVGSPVAGRRLSELEGLIGCFINMLVLRAGFEESTTFEAALVSARGSVLEAHGHQDLPFERLVEELQPQRSLSHTPLFQVLLVYQESPLRNRHLGEASLLPVWVDRGASQFDLTLDVQPQGEGYLAGLDYSTSLFDRTTMDRLAAQLERLLAGAVEHPERRIGDLPLLSEAERHQLSWEWNDATGDVGDPELIQTMFERQAERSPGARALTFGESTLTYREINARANRLAHWLIRQGVGPEARVGIQHERSPEMVVAMLAVHKAGGAYVPMDPSYPRERLALILEDAGVSLVLTRSRLDELAGSLERESQENPPAVAGPGNAAYVIYTSGSTGRPKGVVVTHRNAANLFAAMDRRFGAGSRDVWIAVTSISFDISVTEILWTLSRGLEVVLQPEAFAAAALPLEEQILGRDVTHLQCTPSLARMLVSERMGVEALGSLRRLVVSGEALPPALARQLREAVRGEIHNMYGPTETTVWSSGHRLDEVGETVPIGRPLLNTGLFILDRSFTPVPRGAAGELFIGGRGVARGYLGRPDLTAERFVPDPFSQEPGGRLYATGDLTRFRADGVVEFLGRVDHQVKIRGHRIEPGEIEAVLGKHPAVESVAVAVCEERPGELVLAAYVVPVRAIRPLGDPDERPAAPAADPAPALRAFLRDRLPSYMLPSHLVILDALPLTPSGKIDRRALPPPEPSRPDAGAAYEAPGTEVQKTITGIWQTVLRVERVGLHDNFFELGGTSLSLVEVRSRLRESLSCEVSLVDLFRSPTVASLASLLGPAAERQAPAVDSARQRARRRRLAVQQRHSAGLKDTEMEEEIR